MPKPITDLFTLPKTGVGPKTTEPKGVLNLPEINIEEDKPIEAYEPAPAGSINVIDPNGKDVYVPIDWLLSDGIKKGYRLPPSKNDTGPSQDDLTPDKQIRVVRKDDGTEGTLPLDWYLNDPDAKDYEVLSKAKKSGLQEHIKKVNLELQDINNPDYKEGEKRHENDDVQDDDGNYKLIGPNGDPVLVDQKHLAPLLMSGFKFKDDNFQALYDAHIKAGAEGQVTKELSAAHGGFARLVPGVEWLGNELTSIGPYKTVKAKAIANGVLEQTTQKTAAQIGGGLSFAAQVLSPTGIFGEAKLANAAKAGIAAKLAPEGAGLLRQLAVKGLATGVEGAIISSPQALAQVALDKDPKAAAESLTAGFGIGAFLGVGGKLLGSTAKLAEKGIEHFKPNIADRIVESAGGDVKVFEKLGADKKEFVDALLDKGLSSKSKTDDVLGALKKLSTGEDLVPTLQKLDKVGVKTSVTDLVSELGGSARAFEGVEHASALKGFEDKLIKLADKEGNISLENLQKFVKETAEEIKWSPTDLKKGVGLASEELVKTGYWGQAAQKLTELGDEAASKVDTKTAAEWLKKKSISNMAQYMHAIYFTTEEGAFRATEELNPLVKKLTGELAGKALTGAGAIAGGAIGGGVPGAVIGGAVAEGIKKIGAPILEKAELSLVDHYADSGSKLGNWLVKNKTTSAIGSYLALDATKSLASKVESIGPFLDKLRTTAEKTPAMYLSAQDPVKTILGSEASGLSKAQQYSKLADKAAAYTSNPTVKQQMFDLHIAPLFKDHPELAKQVMADYDKKFQVVNDILKAGNTKQPEAFVQNKPFQPTPAQMKEIEAKLKVVNNPFAILDGLKNGSVTKSQVDIVAQLNPAILQKMREELIKSAYGGKATLSYQQRLSASIIMGAPLDPSLTNGQLLQSTYNNGNNNSNAHEKQPRKQGNSKSLKADRIAGYSLSQRISKV